MVLGHDAKPKARQSRARRPKTESNSHPQGGSHPSPLSMDTVRNSNHKINAGEFGQPNRFQENASALSKEIPAQTDSTRENLEAILEAANIGTWEWNIPTGEVRWSKNMDKVNALVPGSLRGTFTAFLHSVHT